MESTDPPNFNNKLPPWDLVRTLPPSDFSYRQHLRPAFHLGHVLSVPTRLVGPSYQFMNDYHSHPNGMHEEIWRQIEKQKIREEIIAEENARRHTLEAEVRRELMIERELAMQRSDASIYTSQLTSINVDPICFPAFPSPRKMDKGLPGESSGMSTSIRHEFASLQTSSQTSANPKISEFMPPPDTVKGKQKIILPARPKARILGMKRKAEVWPSVSAGELTLAGAGLKKKVKEELSCALCQVTSTSEQALKDHLQGKRHKAKEAGLRKNGKNFSIGLFPKKIVMPHKLLEIPSTPCLQKGVNTAESEKTMTVTPTETNNYPAISQQLDQTMNENKAPHCRTGSMTRKQKFKFWCEMCQKGAFSEKVMNKHRKGKGHRARMLQQNTVGKPSTPIMLTKQVMNLTAESAEVVKATASRNLAPFIEEVKLEVYSKDTGEDGEEVQLAGKQYKAGKDIEDTISGSLDPVTDEVELEAQKKEACEDVAEDTKSGSSVLVINEVELECDQKEESIWQ